MWYIHLDPQHYVNCLLIMHLVALQQLGFMLLALIWEFDFPPFMVLIIAILNDGTSLSCFLHSCCLSQYDGGN